MNAREENSAKKIACVLIPRPGGERGGKGKYFFFYQSPHYLSDYCDPD